MLSSDPIHEMRARWDKRWAGGLEAEAATQLMRVHQIVQLRLDAALREFGLTLARYEALVLLTWTHQGPLPLSKLGDRLMIRPASVTNIVDRLVAQGFIERLQHPTDRRVILAQVSDAGREIVDQATKRIIELHNGLEGFDTGDLELLVELGNKFRRAAGDFDRD